MSGIPDLVYGAAVANVRLVAGVADWFLSHFYPEPNPLAHPGVEPETPEPSDCPEQEHFAAADLTADFDELEATKTELERTEVFDSAAQLLLMDRDLVEQILAAVAEREPQ